VIGFMSDNHLDPDLVEVFVLEPLPAAAQEMH
jgi:hypothetical protein